VTTEKDDVTSASHSDSGGAEKQQKPRQNGPTFTESPDPLSGLRKFTGDIWNSTEGKTVSMRVYIGSIIGIIVLMLLARCGS
jgi:hypothetical protein